MSIRIIRVISGWLLIVGLVIGLVGCDRHESHQPPTDPPVKLERKAENTLPDEIRSIELTTNGKSLLALTNDAIFVLDSKTLRKTKAIPLKDKNDDGHLLSTYWSADGFVISPDQRHVLVVDKYIEIETGSIETILDVASALTKGRPNPSALAISPSGNLALILVYSCSAAKFNALAVFDLKTGKLINARQTGKRVSYAIFLSEDKLLVFYTKGIITIEDFKGTPLRKLASDAPVPRDDGNNVSVVTTNNTKTLIVSGPKRDKAWCVCAFDLVRHKLLFQEPCYYGSPTSSPDSSWVFYQTRRPSKTLCDCGKHHLVDLFLNGRNLQSGDTAELKVDETFDLIIVNPTENVLFCADFDKVLRLALPENWCQELVSEPQKNRDEGNGE